MKDRLFDSLEVRNFRAFDLLQIEQLGHINTFSRAKISIFIH